jgi:uncharacterized protein involved in outer membrane biogenesis
MLKFLVRALIGVAVLMVALVAGAYVVLQDPNRFKPEIEEFVAEQTGVQVDIGNDLHWVLFPPLGLSAKEVKAEYEGSTYELASMQLDLDLMSVLRTRDIDQWQVTALTLGSPSTPPPTRPRSRIPGSARQPPAGSAISTRR